MCICICIPIYIYIYIYTSISIYIYIEREIYRERYRCKASARSARLAGGAPPGRSGAGLSRACAWRAGAPWPTWAGGSVILHYKMYVKL